MSKSLKKLIDINRLREFKNKLVGAGSAYVQTSAVDQTIAGTKTFSKPIVGSVTGSSGSCTGNAATATTATSVPWSGVTGKPSSYTPAAHTQAASTITGLAKVATSGSYTDLSNKPTIPVIDSALSATSTNGLQNKVIKTALDGKANSSHTHTRSQITDFPALATVATSGSYNDLTNKPAIPTVNNATLTIQKNGTTVKTFTANASANVTANITVPTKVSELTNDSGFLTSHQSLSNYVTLNGVQTISGAKTFTGNIIGINKERSTEDANSLYSTTAGSKLTYYTTSNGGTKLANVPAAVNTTLESRTIRRLSDSDWIVEQICHNSNGLYYRKGGNGTWGAWKTFAFTDSNISGNAATATTATTAKACTGNAATATKATKDSDGNQINTTYSKVGHTHDDRYYTENEVNNLLKGKANTSGTYSNLTVGNAGSATNATNATNSNAANQLQAFVNDNFTGGNHYVKAIRSSQGWSTHLWMCYNNGAKMADEVSVNYANSAGSANTANSATKATQDSDGNRINTTYVKKTDAQNFNTGASFIGFYSLVSQIKGVGNGGSLTVGHTTSSSNIYDTIIANQDAVTLSRNVTLAGSWKLVSIIKKDSIEQNSIEHNSIGVTATHSPGSSYSSGVLATQGLFVRVS